MALYLIVLLEMLFGSCYGQNLGETTKGQHRHAINTTKILKYHRL